jgi:hypothetical protein
LSIKFAWVFLCPWRTVLILFWNWTQFGFELWSNWILRFVLYFILILLKFYKTMYNFSVDRVFCCCSNSVQSFISSEFLLMFFSFFVLNSAAKISLRFL